MANDADGDVALPVGPRAPERVGDHHRDRLAEVAAEPGPLQLEPRHRLQIAGDEREPVLVRPRAQLAEQLGDARRDVPRQVRRAEPRVGRRRLLVFAAVGHPGDNGRKYRIEALVHFAQSARDIHDSSIYADRHQAHTGRATDEPSEHDDVEAKDERVQKLIRSNWRRVSHQRQDLGSDRDSFSSRGLS